VFTSIPAFQAVPQSALTFQSAIGRSSANLAAQGILPVIRIAWPGVF
jgi:hypothetical protein